MKKLLSKKEKKNLLILLTILVLFLILENTQRFQFDGLFPSSSLFAETSLNTIAKTQNTPLKGPPDDGGAPKTPLWETDFSTWLNILATLLLASVLSGLISYRRKGGKAQIDFTEAHIVLSAASALMMMIIGSQIARAFGLMGAASIVRYRYSLKSPKEASSLVIALGVGMACGVGLYSLAIISSLYIVLVINALEYMPQGLRKLLFPSNWAWNMRIRTLNPDETQEIIKEYLAEENVSYKVKRILGGKGTLNNQTEIELEIFSDIDKDSFSEVLSGDNIVRIRWKQQSER